MISIALLCQRARIASSTTTIGKIIKPINPASIHIIGRYPNSPFHPLAPGSCCPLLPIYDGYSTYWCGFSHGSGFISVVFLQCIWSLLALLAAKTLHLKLSGSHNEVRQMAIYRSLHVVFGLFAASCIGLGKSGSRQTSSNGPTRYQNTGSVASNQHSVKKSKLLLHE